MKTKIKEIPDSQREWFAESTHYPLRNVPADLWQVAKLRSVHEGTTLREMLIEGLRLRLAQPVKIQHRG